MNQFENDNLGRMLKYLSIGKENKENYDFAYLRFNNEIKQDESFQGSCNDVIIQEVSKTAYEIYTYPFKATRCIKNKVLTPKYDKIKSLHLIGFGNLSLPNIPSLENQIAIDDSEANELYGLCYEMPPIMAHIGSGLGFKHEYRFIIEQIEKIDGLDTVVIVNSEIIEEIYEISVYPWLTKLSEEKYSQLYNSSICVNDKSFYVLDDYLDDIRRKLDRLSEKYQERARKEKSIYCNNNILNVFDSELYPEQQPEVLVSSLLSRSKKVSKEKIDNTLQQCVKEYIKLDKDNSNKIIKDIETTRLEALINSVEGGIISSKTEGFWQKLFSENSFIFNLVFGFPVVMIQDSAHVGGTSFKGDGEKISDFLIKNNITNNVALVEIKTAKAPLLYTKNEYRKGIYRHSSELSGGITQVLDQKYQLQDNFLLKLKNSEDRNLENYNIHCALIIGCLPKNKDELKSFELIRGNSHNVQIITYDELLEKLQITLNFLNLN